MPRATLDTTEQKRVDLKTCPEGYVTLKRMSYGDILVRRELQLKMTMTMDSKQKGATEANVQMSSVVIAQFEFAKCVIDHNLEDANGRTLNLGSPVDFAKLDPQIGQEIETAISDMNNYEGDEADFSATSVPPSSSDGTLTQTSSSPSS